MRRRLTGLVLGALAGAILLATGTPARAQQAAGEPKRQWAFLVGVEQYKYIDPSLDYAVNDVIGLRDSLIRLGFQSRDIRSLADPDQLRGVLDLSDDERQQLAPTKSNIEQELRAFLNQDIGEDDLVVFAFSGHGMNDRGTASYLVPADATEDPRTQIKLEAVLKQISATKARYKAAMIDACRNVPGKLTPRAKDISRRGGGRRARRSSSSTRSSPPTTSGSSPVAM